MVRVLAIERSSLPTPPGCTQLLAGALVDEAGDRAAAGRVDRRPRRPRSRWPARIDGAPAGLVERRRRRARRGTSGSRRRARRGRGTRRRRRDGPPVVARDRPSRRTNGHARRRRRAARARGPVAGQVDADPDDVRARPRQRVEHGHRRPSPAVSIAAAEVRRARRRGRPCRARAPPASRPAGPGRPGRTRSR